MVYHRYHSGTTCYSDGKRRQERRVGQRRRRVLVPCAYARAEPPTTLQYDKTDSEAHEPFAALPRTAARMQATPHPPRPPPDTAKYTRTNTCIRGARPAKTKRVELTWSCSHAQETCD